jgi:glutamyl-tRNA synthetase
VAAVHVGRYAPSPTGDLHLGNARTALLAWLWARHDGGRILLRIEDLDRARVRPGSEEAQRRDLAALGLNWDGPVVHQSERGAMYVAALDRLEAAGLLYPCFCSRADIRAAASAPHGPEGPPYPGTCRELDPAAAAARLAAGEQAALRFREGDVVVRRRDGVVAYQLAVVVDDADQGVTHVLRGDDLEPSTARQLALWRALELGPEPQYAHVPLLLGPDGERLAKRHGAVSVAEALADGATAESLVGWLAWTAGLQAEPSPRRPAYLVENFARARLLREPFTVRSAPGREPVR